MKQLKIMFVLFAAVAMMLTSGCATANRFAQVSAEEDMYSTSFKKLTREKVVQRLGKPDQRLNNNGVWVYKKSNDKHKIMNAVTHVLTDYMYVDTLTLTFSNDVVSQQSYDEEVLNVSLPGGAKSLKQ